MNAKFFDQPSCDPQEWPTVLRWAREYLPEYFNDQPSRFHAELLADLECSPQRLLARVAPRGHAKSTCGALAYPLWCICNQRRKNVVIITHESSLATQFVSDIRGELETNEAILAEYGDLCAGGDTDETKRKSASKRRKRGRWSQAKLITATGVAVQAKGTGASFRGTKVGPHRPDLVICDDIEKDEHVETAEGRRKLEHWLRRVVMPALTPDGQLVVLGSIIHHDSLLANLRDKQRWPRWDYRVYRALEAEPHEDGGYEKVALWPARWPVDRLELERERIGTLAFEQEYMANPIDDSVRVFRPEWLGRYAPAEIANQELVTIMAIDPATGTSGGDYFALWVGSIAINSGRIYTRKLQLERIGIVQQLKRILREFERWQPVRIGIETVAYQVALKEILEEESRKRGLYLPIVALQTTSNKRARIESIAPLFENGTFLLPEDVPAEVEEQFLHFPKARHDDAPDVCAMGVAVARSLRCTGKVEGLTLDCADNRPDDW
jgi:predicted phage terminase large subunit-like protein